VVSSERLKELGATLTITPASEAVKPSKNGKTVNATGGISATVETLQAYVEAHGLKVQAVKEHADHAVLSLAVCPFNADHTDSAAIIRRADGAVGFKCHHNSCNGKTWKEVRDLIHPGRFATTDLANAERLAYHFGDTVRYDHTAGRWLLWDGKRWKPDTSAEIMRMAGRVALAIFDEAAKAGSPKMAEELGKWGVKSQSRDRLTAMVALAQSQQCIAITAEMLDADPWLLNVENGTINLRDGTMREHRPSDYITKLAPTEYIPGATHPVWERFLDTSLIEAEEELAPFVQRAAGYTITGLTTEEKLLVILGPAASGKTTFVEAMKAVLGDYSATADFETFIERPNSSGPRNDIARLAGARFVPGVEVSDGRRLAQGLCKQLTGGDTITARFLYREAFEFRPQFKLWLVANHAPLIDGEDDGMWRRIVRVPFERVIPRDDRDPAVKETLRSDLAARSAVLAWCVQGCLEWQRIGLSIPECVSMATDAYRQDMDPLREFFEESCVFSQNMWTPNATLRGEYLKWCEAVGINRPLHPKSFAARLKAKGCTPAKYSARGWSGIGLRGALAELEVE